MQAPVDDHAELVIDSLRHWKPVKVISDCRCNVVELPFPHNQSCGRVKNSQDFLEVGPLKSSYGESEGAILVHFSLQI